MKPIIAVWFSCGAASAVAAKKTIEKYGQTHTIRVVNNPVAEEEEDNRRFLADVEKWLGVKIETATCSKYPAGSAVEVWERERYMSVSAKRSPWTLTSSPAGVVKKHENAPLWIFKTSGIFCVLSTPTRNTHPPER